MFVCRVTCITLWGHACSLSHYYCKYWNVIIAIRPNGLLMFRQSWGREGGREGGRQRERLFFFFRGHWLIMPHTISPSNGVCPPLLCGRGDVRIWWGIRHYCTLCFLRDRWREYGWGRHVSACDYVWEMQGGGSEKGVARTPLNVAFRPCVNIDP